MKNKLYSCALLLLIISFPACMNEDINPLSDNISVATGMNFISEHSADEETNLSLESDNNSVDLIISTEYNIRDDGYIWNYFDTLSVLIKDEKNYKIYKDKGHISFRFEVFNNYGELIDQGYHGWRGSFGLSFNDDGILVLDDGAGGSIWSRRYYDVSNSRVSRFYFKPIQTHGELVAYFTTREENDGFVLVVQNMFDPLAYYQEIKRDFSIFVSTMPSTGGFIDDGKKLSVTYWLNPDDREVTEIIDLDL